MRFYIMVATLACLPGAALACPAGETAVFSCTVQNGKVVQVCQAPEQIRYTFGRAGAAPEMTIAVPNSEFVWHSDGGSAIDTTDLNFDHRGTRYVVSATRYRDEDPPLDAHIRVERGVEQVANVVCRDESVRLDEQAITTPKTLY